MQTQRKGACALLTKSREVLSKADITISQTEETLREPLKASAGLRWGCAGSEASARGMGDYTEKSRMKPDHLQSSLTMCQL